ncbi:hypothetical protein B0H14DRAFT_3881956 [Mycena olivaceomarginata]|nr:hypothetical protein B0H14DRAFT_3881956 [Mycena olivaceomarginata]
MLMVPRIDLGTPSRYDSRAMSTISQTDSTRHILGPPHRRRPPPPLPQHLVGARTRTHSHTLNYLPSKFSCVMVSRRRNFEKDSALGGMVPRGRGVAAFRADAARMAAEGDGDYNGVDVRRHSLFPPLSALTQRKLRWTRFKSILFLANLVLSLYALALLVFVILTYQRTLPPPPVLVLTAALGRGGVLLNNRGMLAVYTLLLWVSLWADGGAGINQQWSQQLGAQGRLTVQETLGCCGYFSPFVEATISTSCYARSALPGCKSAFRAFQEKTLVRWYTIAFGLVPVHIEGGTRSGEFASSLVVYILEGSMTN